MERDINVSEITNMITNKDHVRNDMIEITNVVKDFLNEKYILKMNELISKHQEKVNSNPTKEVILMQAIKPFMQREAQLNIDRLIQMMNTLNAVRSIQQEFQQVRLQNTNENS